MSYGKLPGRNSHLFAKKKGGNGRKPLESSYLLQNGLLDILRNDIIIVELH
jgi:hypothetical protein